MSQERIIKKYPNRRLYDTEESRYITLTEVKDLVMRTVDFRVVDSNTEQDLTRAILLQIILEQESGGQPIFSSNMLSHFIRFYGDAAQSTLTSFLEQGLDYMLKQQRLVQDQVQDVWGANPVELWAAWSRRNMDFWSGLAAKPGTNGDASPEKTEPK